MKSGRIHFHLLVVLAGGVDIRTGFSFEQAGRGVYASANDALRKEWTFWRTTAPLYGFGRTELMPVKSTAEGLAKYVGKYIAKHIGAREARDRRVKLVRYSKGVRSGTNEFMFASPRSRLWRWQVSEFARANGCDDLASLSVKFGKRWAHHKGREIRSIAPESWDLREIYEADRVALAVRVAHDLATSQADAYVRLFQANEFVDAGKMDFSVPRWTGQKCEAGPDFSDVTLCMNGAKAVRISNLRS
jgi:hypothetical protein